MSNVPYRTQESLVSSYLALSPGIEEELMGDVIGAGLAIWTEPEPDRGTSPGQRIALRGRSRGAAVAVVVVVETQGKV